MLTEKRAPPPSPFLPNGANPKPPSLRSFEARAGKKTQVQLVP